MEQMLALEMVRVTEAAAIASARFMGRGEKDGADRAAVEAMRRAMDETDRRRTVQTAYNEEHGITPQSIINTMDMGLAQILKAEYGDITEEEAAELPDFASQAELDAYIAKLETQMREAAKKFEFEKAARLRDSIKELRDKEFLFG